MSRVSQVALTGFAALAACLPQKHATEVIVTVDTPFGVPCVIDTLHFEVKSPRGTVTKDVALTEGDLPGSITLAPADDSGKVTVTVTGMRGLEVFASASDDVQFEAHDSLEMRFLLDDTCITAPCTSLGVGEYKGLPKAVARASCGAKAYTQSADVFTMRDACDMAGVASTTVLDNGGLGTDEMEVPSPLTEMPFPFRFYNTPVTQFYIGSNGYIAFTDTPPHALISDVGTVRSLGDNGSFPKPGVLPFWDDLRTGPRGVCVATSGEFPNRVLWITWQDACFASTSQTKCTVADGSLTFSIALEETTNRIYLGYQSMTAPDDAHAHGNSATIGITNGGTKGCAVCGTDGTCDGSTPCGYTQYSFHQAADLSQTVLMEPTK